MPNPTWPTLTRDEVRALDAAAIEQLGIPGLILMENAARGVVDVVLDEYSSLRRILIACGYGNNGGDGLAIARLLAAHRTRIDVKLLRGGKTLSADAAVNFAILTNSSINVDETDDLRFAGAVGELEEDDLIIDCLLGTGVRGAVRSPFDQAIAAINSSAANVLSVDLPSGMDCDSGEACGCCVRASRTVTFVGRKKGFDAKGASALTGDVTVAHIGLPMTWVINWLESSRA